MNVVIPLRPRPVYQTLHATLDSIREHTDYQVVIIGADPKYKGVKHIPTRERRPQKFTGQEAALRIAATTDWISDPFIYSNDDILWTQPATPIRWALGNLRDDTRTNEYGRRKHRTADILDRLGLPTGDYESHTPLPVTKAGILEALLYCGDGGNIRSLYGNLTGTPDRIAPDVKIRRPTDGIPTGEWLSVAHHRLIPEHMR